MYAIIMTLATYQTSQKTGPVQPGTPYLTFRTNNC